MELFKRLNDEGTTIIQVTHNEKNAEYGQRIIQLVDGWITDTKETVGREAAKT
jgi:ABC-type lipoprotein export system ATPase subunit